MKQFNNVTIKLKRLSKKQRLLAYALIGLVILSLSAFIYIKSALAATNCWTGGGVTENWSETANWSLGVAPGVSGNTTNLATFGSASCASGLTKNVTIDTNIDLSGSGGGILISATTNAYTGIITQGTSTITIGSGNYSQAGGTFTGGSGTIDINGSYSLTGGIFTSSSDTTTGMSVTGNFTISGSPTFSANSGVVSFTGTSQTLSCGGTTTFNGGKVVINTTSLGFTVNSNCNLPLGDTPTVTLGSNPGFTLNGTLSGTGTLNMNFSDTSRALRLNAGAALSGFTGLNFQGGLNIQGATTDFSSYTTFNLWGPFTFASGSFTAPPIFTIAGTAFNVSYTCGNVTFTKVVVNKTQGSISVGSDCNFPLGDNPSVVLGNNPSMTLGGTLSGTGTLTIDMSTDTSRSLTMNSGASFSGFNGVVFKSGLTISGATVDLSSYGTVILQGPFSFTSGSFTAPPVFNLTGSSGAITNLNCGSTTLKDVTVNKNASNVYVTLTGNCTVANFTLTQGTMSNPSSAYTLSVTGNFTQNANTAFGGANLTLAMTGAGNQTYTRSTGTFVSAFTVNKTGGTVTLASSLNTGTTSTGQACNITSGTLDLAGNTLVCASLTVANGGNLQWRGSETITLTSPTTPTLSSGSTVTFTGTSGTNSYTIPTTWGNFSNLTINAPTGTNTFNLGADLTVGKNLTISAGTFDATASLYNVTIGGNFTQNGTMTARNNTFTFNDATQNSVITGSSGITFYNLTSTTASKILKFGAGSTFRVNGLLTITGTANNQVNLSSATSGTPWATTTEKFSNTGFESDLTGWTSSTQTLTLQPNNGTDTEIRIDGWDGTAVDTNYGTDWYYSIGKGAPNERRNRILIQFDLSSLPDAATISSATLSLYATSDQSDNARTFRVYRLKRAWVETQATWNIFSTGNSWQTAGGFGTDDAEQTEIGSRNFTASETVNQFKDFSLTPTTKSGLDLGNGWLIKADTEVADSYTFETSEFSTNAENPKLVINYTSANRNTSTTYNGSTGSVQLIPGTSAGTFTQSVNVGDTNTYNLTAYTYTTGAAVTSADVSLYANGSTVSTTYTSVGSGWYKLTGTATGVASSVGYGVQVQAGKTVYLDNMSLMAGSLSQQWTINLQGTSSITYAFVQDSACDGTSLSISLDGTSRNGGNNGTCWSGYPTAKNATIKGSTTIKGNTVIGH